MNEHFSIERTWWLLRADLASGYRSLLMVSGTLAGAILLISLLSFDGDTDVPGFFVSAFSAILFVWGAIASSHAFRELHDKTRNEAWLLTQFGRSGHGFSWVGVGVSVGSVRVG